MKLQDLFEMGEPPEVAWEKYLRAVFGKPTLSRLHDYYTADDTLHNSIPRKILERAKRYFSVDKIKQIVLSTMLKRLKEADDKDDYLSIKNIIDHIRFEAIDHPEFKWKELDAIEKSVKDDLERLK